MNTVGEVSYSTFPIPQVYLFPPTVYYSCPQYSITHELSHDPQYSPSHLLFLSTTLLLPHPCWGWWASAPESAGDVVSLGYRKHTWQLPCRTAVGASSNWVCNKNTVWLDRYEVIAYTTVHIKTSVPYSTVYYITSHHTRHSQLTFMPSETVLFAMKGMTSMGVIYFSQGFFHF